MAIAELPKTESIALPYPGDVIQLPLVSPAQQIDAQERILKWNGLIRIFIHPFYEENIRSRCWDNHTVKNTFPRILAPEKGLERLLALEKAKTPPIFVFEEAINCADTTKRLQKMNQNSGNDIYLIPTVTDCSVPYLPMYNRNIYAGPWVYLVSIFRDLYVKKIIIAGQRLIIEPGTDHLNDQGVGYRAYRCVGSAIDRLRPHFNVIVSGMTHPHSRVDINRVNQEYKGQDDDLDKDMDYM